MTRLPITPRKISLEEVYDYTASWLQLLGSGSPAELQACFTSSNKELSNYAYLTPEVLTPLLDGFQPTDLVKTKFLLLPGDNPVFSLALIRTDDKGQPQSDHYLAGIAELPATLGPEFAASATPEAGARPVLTGKVPITVARTWIMSWHKLAPADLTAHFFDSPLDGQYLRGYVFDVSDFTTPWPYQGTAAAPPEDAALWLNFDLKPQTDAPDSPQVFSTIVEINKIPPAEKPGEIALQEQAEFYDVSRPSPPY